MKKIVILIIFLSSVLFKHISLYSSERLNIGLAVMATGRYIKFIPELLASARKYFCKNHNVKFFVFTDNSLFKDNIDTIKIEQKRLGWPFDSMMRFNIYYNNKDKFSSLDYMFSCDADMLFVDYVGDEILSDRVATIHYLFADRVKGVKTVLQKPYDSNPKSTAYIQPNKGKYYFAGAFYGGTLAEFLRICNVCRNNIAIDLSRGIKAYVFDESHLNRYFVDNKPTKMLPAAYCVYEPYISQMSYKCKIVSRLKNQKELIK